MKANELRIGNLIIGEYTHDYDRKEQLLCKVVVIDSVGETQHSIWVDSNSSVETFDDFKPIPLTEDWLKRFGIKNDIDVWELTGVFWLQELEDGCFFLGCNSGWTGIEIKYVHQLQNLYFALTGEELKSLEK